MPEYQGKMCPVLTAAAYGKVHGIVASNISVEVHCREDDCQWWGFCKLAPLLEEALKFFVSDHIRIEEPQAEVLTQQMIDDFVEADRKGFEMHKAEAEHQECEAIEAFLQAQTKAVVNIMLTLSDSQKGFWEMESQVLGILRKMLREVADGER